MYRYLMPGLVQYIRINDFELVAVELQKMLTQIVYNVRYVYAKLLQVPDHGGTHQEVQLLRSGRMLQ